ncbi:hypothetical protein BH10BAC1_BH10BAC1_17430 [soil metagenome]
MRKQYKKYSSFLFLFLFLFPIAEKGLHALEHHNSIHCSITDKHFHQQEHACSICDFTITDSNGAPNSEITFITFSQSFLFSSFIESEHIPYAFTNLPARAPPIA